MQYITRIPLHHTNFYVSIRYADYTNASNPPEKYIILRCERDDDTTHSELIPATWAQVDIVKRIIKFIKYVQP
jgi:hypothetical protein